MPSGLTEIDHTERHLRSRSLTTITLSVDVARNGRLSGTAASSTAISPAARKFTAAVAHSQAAAAVPQGHLFARWVWRRRLNSVPEPY